MAGDSFRVLVRGHFFLKRLAHTVRRPCSDPESLYTEAVVLVVLVVVLHTRCLVCLLLFYYLSLRVYVDQNIGRHIHVFVSRHTQLHDDRQSDAATP